MKTYLSSSSSSASASSSVSSSSSTPRELSREEKDYLYGVPGKVETLLTNKMHEKALKIIDGYLTKSPSPTPEKLSFFKALKEKIIAQQLKKTVNFHLNVLVGQTFQKMSRSEEKIDLSENLASLFKTIPLCTSAAAKCLFTLIGIYSLQFLFLDPKIITDIVALHPAFKEMVNQKSISQRVLGAIAAPAPMWGIIHQVEQLCKEHMLQFSSTAECLTSESLDGELEDWVNKALRLTYWQPVFTGEPPSEEQLIKQKELNLACEQGDIDVVKALLRPWVALAARPDLPDHSGQLPLPTAVWGMNLAVVEAVLQAFQEKGLKPPSWSECLTHNKSRWNTHFILSEFKTATEGVLDEIVVSPFLRAEYLKAKGLKPNLFYSSAKLWEIYTTEKAIQQDRYGIGRSATLPSKFSRLTESIQEKITNHRFKI